METEAPPAVQVRGVSRGIRRALPLPSRNRVLRPSRFDRRSPAGAGEQAGNDHGRGWQTSDQGQADAGDGYGDGAPQNAGDETKEETQTQRHHISSRWTKMK